MEMRDLFPATGNGNGNSSGTGRRIVETYQYRDASGAVLREKVRFVPKSFAWRHRDASGEYVWGAGDGPKVLFNLRELVTRPDDLVWLVEGEKDVETLGKLGLLAVSGPDGAAKGDIGRKWLPAYNESLCDRNLAIIPDGDEAGWSLANHIAGECHNVARSVKVVVLPTGKDATEFIDAGGTKDELLALVATAPEYVPMAPKPAPAEHDACNIKLTDTGNAERVAMAHGDDLRYLRFGRQDSGHWLIWRGTHWAADDTGAIWQRAKQTIRGIYDELLAEPDPDRRQALAKHAVRSESDQRIRAMINLARSEPPIPVTAAMMDADPWALNVRNGTIDLRTGELRPHRREDYITRLCPVDFDPAAEAPRFARFLDEIFAGADEVKPFLQRLVGYFLTGDVRDHILPIFFGAGRNGKNTLIDTVMGLLGDYAAPAPPNLLTSRRSDEHPTELADLCGRRLVVASETEEGRHLRVALVKSITGDTFIKARYMRHDYFAFARTHKTVLLTNNPPRIRERSVAIWSRVLLVPFNVSFAGREDFELPKKLQAEWPGILAWAVQGCLAWRRDGLQIPDVVRVATDTYRGEQDVIGPFIDECCHVAPVARTSRAGLWVAYIDWAKRAGEHPLDRNALYGRLRERGFRDVGVRENGRPMAGFAGIGLSSRPKDVETYTPVETISGLAPMNAILETNGKGVSTGLYADHTPLNDPENAVLGDDESEPDWGNL